MCACKFRLNVQKPAIATILPVCRCRHRDETARDSGPGTSEKPGCHPTQTRPPGTNNHNPLEAKRLPQPAQNPHLVINVHGRSLIRSANPRCRRPRPSCIHGRRLLQPPHAHPERAGKPGPATRHASTTHDSIVPGRSEENSPGRRHRILHIRRTVKTRHHALAKGGHTRDRNQRPSCPTPGKWPHAKARHDSPRKRPTVEYCAPKAEMSIGRPTSGARPAPFHHMKPDGYRSNIKPSHKILPFRLSDLTAEEVQNLHCAKEHYWRPVPGKKGIDPFSTVQTPHRV